MAWRHRQTPRVVIGNRHCEHPYLVAVGFDQTHDPVRCQVRFSQPSRRSRLFRLDHWACSSPHPVTWPARREANPLQVISVNVDGEALAVTRLCQSTPSRRFRFRVSPQPFPEIRPRRGDIVGDGKDGAREASSRLWQTA